MDNVLMGNLTVRVQFNKRAERRGESVPFTDRLPRHSSVWLGGTARPVRAYFIKNRDACF